MVFMVGGASGRDVHTDQSFKDTTNVAQLVFKGVCLREIAWIAEVRSAQVRPPLQLQEADPRFIRNRCFKMP
tara:strand:- start:12544 stop:12759 length:216 start_codon:yes stop_codon:yes gene_type:complete